MYKILLLNGEGVQVVSLAKALHKNGAEISAICESKLSSGYCTRWLDNKYVSPSIVQDFDKFSNFFYDHISKIRYDAIIPTADESAEFLTKEKARIESEYGIKCAIPDPTIYYAASDKHNLMTICKRIGVGHPKTLHIEKSNLKEAAEYVGFPSLIKPNFSAGARGIVRVNSVEELAEKYPNILKTYGDCTLQQYVEQPDYYYNVMLYRDYSGKITGQTVIKIRRFFPLSGGTSCYSETVYEESLVKECVHVLEEIDWHGFADFDVLVDYKTGEYRIIEINPRVPSSLQASFAAGVDFAECYLRDLFGGTVMPCNYTEGKQIRWFGLDVMWFLMSPKRFSFKPSWFNFWGKNVSYHDGAWNDPLPMVAGCFEGIKKYLNPEFRKSKLKKI